ncbi:efflux transporter outer membrane subunit [Dysgonomonas sp. 520]|uniref:efflux transporter outer membrane subunit n=1 Tax=Dysgonomonas sp. 520 TaxID=2302931 RepID=UPI0013D4F5F2|nr:efflux transporter outer membrane subunit [Dysgonomonas sp. 520]NDW09851.1 efflux transporter outer membrane subunit [Dysgonomonas sp. 520]
MSSKNIKGYVLLGVILSIGLQSCNITKSYKAPEVDTENMYRDMNPTDTTTIASIPWREYFKDPLLQALIDECLENNFDLKIAGSRLEQAGANLSIAKAAFFPTVALGAQVEHNRNSRSGDVLKDYSNAYSLGLVTTWELDLWGKMSRQKKAAFAQFLSSQEYRNLVQTNLISGVATSYYTLLSLDEQLRVSKEAIVLLREMVTTMDELMKAGMQNGAAVEQTKATLYNTEVSIPDLENSIKQLENSISTMLGRKPGPITRGSLADQVVPQELKVGLPVQMLARRPDVKSAELGMRSAFELAVAAQASLYPSIKLTSGMIGYGSNTLSKFFQPENILASLIGGLTQPLFAGNQLKANLKIQKAEQQIALLTFEKTVLTAGQEVSDIMYTYETSMRKNEFRDKQVESLEKSVEYTQLLLKAGEANYIEVITAEQSLLQAQLGRVSDKLQQLQSTVDLYKALGGGVE